MRRSYLSNALKDRETFFLFFLWGSIIFLLCCNRCNCVPCVLRLMRQSFGAVIQHDCLLLQMNTNRVLYKQLSQKYICFDGWKYLDGNICTCLMKVTLFRKWPRTRLTDWENWNLKLILDHFYDIFKCLRNLNVSGGFFTINSME